MNKKMPGNISNLPDDVTNLIKSFFEPQDVYIPSSPDFKQLLYASCLLVVKNIGMSLTPLENTPKINSIQEWVQYIADQSDLRMRKVSLSDEWYKFDNGPLVVFKKESMHPYAAIPDSFGKYQLYDTENGTSKLLTIEDSKLLFSDMAFCFYPSFPNKTLEWKEIILFILKSQKTNLKYLALVYLILHLIGLVLPTLTGVVIDRVIPNADMKLLHQALLGLGVIAISTVLFTAAQSLIFMRIKFKINANLQPAIWDRVLKLPVSFFYDYTTGDLSSRIKSIDYIQQTVSATTFFAVISGLFSVFSLILLFMFNAQIGFIALGITIIYLIVSAVVNIRLVTYFTKYFDIHGKTLSTLFQIILNVSKLKLMRRESNICSIWMKKYFEKTFLYYKIEMLSNGFSIIILTIQIFSTLLFFSIALLNRDSLTLGTFIIINAIYGQYFSSISSMLNSITSFIELIPHSKRANPLINNDLEEAIGDQDPGILTGELTIKNLYFSYKKSGKAVLKDVSLTLKPGSCTTLIGNSGAGKSTLLRLLLGFETPTSGSIYYDGKDIKSLNVSKIRKQMGIILQNTSLMPGTIFDNITNFNISITITQVEEIMKLLGAEQFIKALPMGLQTYVSESGTTFSAGQRQIILLARALIYKPRILLLDESTSALDQSMQACVNKVLNDLKVTRLVITQNTSSIQNNESVYKMENHTLIPV